MVNATNMLVAAAGAAVASAAALYLLKTRKSKAIKWLSNKDVEAWIDRYDTVLFDCDGVIWLDTEAVPNVPETLALLRKKGKRILFVSNNATKHRSQYLDKFKKMGIEATIDDVVTSAVGSAVYFVERHGKGAKVYACGTQGLVRELEDAGATLVRPPNELDTQILISGPQLCVVDPEVKAVVAGADWNLTHRKLSYAVQCLLKFPGCELIATNGDRLYPAGDGNFYPGAGATVKSIEFCSGKTPVFIGKPGPMLLDLLEKTKGMDKSRTVMIGDRIDTDIEFGNVGGVETLLVLTGCTPSREKAEESKGVQRPMFGIRSFGDIGVALGVGKAL